MGNLLTKSTNKQQQEMHVDAKRKEEEEIDRTLKEATKLANSSHVKQAISLVSNALIKYKDNFDLRYFLGSLHDTLGEVDKAIDIWKEGITNEPPYKSDQYKFILHHLEGCSYLNHSKQLAVIIVDYACPNMDDFNYHYLIAKRKSKEAKDGPTVSYSLGTVTYGGKNKDLTELQKKEWIDQRINDAMYHFKRAIKLYYEPTVYSTYGRFLEWNKNDKDALEIWKVLSEGLDINKHEESSLVIWMGIARCYFKLQEYKECSDILETHCLKIDSSHNMIYDLLEKCAVHLNASNDDYLIELGNKRIFYSHIPGFLKLDYNANNWLKFTKLFDSILERKYEKEKPEKQTKEEEDKKEEKDENDENDENEKEEKDGNDENVMGDGEIKQKDEEKKNDDCSNLRSNNIESTDDAENNDKRSNDEEKENNLIEFMMNDDSLESSKLLIAYCYGHYNHSMEGKIFNVIIDRIELNKHNENDILIIIIRDILYMDTSPCVIKGAANALCRLNDIASSKRLCELLINDKRAFWNMNIAHSLGLLKDYNSIHTLIAVLSPPNMDNNNNNIYCNDDESKSDYDEHDFMMHDIIGNRQRCAISMGNFNDMKLNKKIIDALNNGALYFKIYELNICCNLSLLKIYCNKLNINKYIKDIKHILMDQMPQSMLLFNKQQKTSSIMAIPLITSQIEEIINIINSYNDNKYNWILIKCNEFRKLLDNKGYNIKKHGDGIMSFVLAPKDKNENNKNQQNQENENEENKQEKVTTDSQ